MKLSATKKGPRLPAGEYLRRILTTVLSACAQGLLPSAICLPHPKSANPGKDFDDMHWFLHPRLGDYAILNKKPRAVQLAGFFNKHWHLEAQ